MSPRKVRLIADVIRGMDVEKAESQLHFMQKRAVGPVRKLLHSAVSNAEHNHELESANLYIQSIIVNEGPSLKRFKPRAFGRAAPIRKRTTHMTIILGERTPSKKRKQPQKAKSITSNAAEKPVVAPEEIKRELKDKQTDRERPAEKQKQGRGAFAAVKRVFSRRTGER